MSGVIPTDALTLNIDGNKRFHSIGTLFFFLDVSWRSKISLYRDD